ncbi:uncharacterized protein [Littorina saxatilis]|uniref:uncharacterized protein isoform X2 n=1 Tax=Littorina saxatilis TaxID=31220 RepID=UPI0038B4A825
MLLNILTFSNTMGSCVSREEISARNHLILDVQQIIADDAWEEFLVSSRRRFKFWRPIKRSDYTIEVPTNYYHFEETKQVFNEKKRLPSMRSNEVPARGAKQGGDSHFNNPEEIGLKTEFKNDTDRAQTYNFRFEKTRRAAVTVSYQKGFSIGGNTSFTIGLPKVLAEGQLSSEINMNYEVTSSREQTFEETLTTEATSIIQVSKFNNCTASVVMEERRMLAEFKLWVTMYMPEGQALVYIKNRKGRTVFLKVIENLSMLFPEEYHIPDQNNQPREDAVQFIVHGIVDGKQLANHYIHLKGEKIAPGLEEGEGAASVRGSGGEGAGDAKLTEVELTDL